MKKFITFVLILILALPAAASADVDLSGMTFDELVVLREQLNLAIWNSKEWQEVTVPIGVWKVGEDIPVNHWSISLSPETSSRWSTIIYCDQLSESGFDAGINCKINEFLTVGSPENDKAPKTIDIDLKPGTFLIIEKGAVVFTPYAGKPDLGFK